MTNTPAAKLSRLQKEILRLVLWWSSQAEDHGNEAARHWGAASSALYVTRETRREQAAKSRAVARLERRGLLLRQCRASAGVRLSSEQAAPSRATYLTLTELGRSVAAGL